MIIAIASGKGGTGKTTVAVNLARSLDQAVQVVDCDVEEPNAHLFLGGELAGRETVNVLVPEVDESLCDGCGECSRVCRFNAIVSFGSKPLLFPEMCHGCGGCARICPTRAIRETGRRIGDIETRNSGLITLVQGRLDVGVAMAPPLVRAVKEKINSGTDAILDAPPGTSCPVIATLRGVDAAVLVTEPTPFGLHDLQLAVEMIRELNAPFGVVVNRAGAGDGRVHDFCRQKDIPLLMEFPDDRRIAEAYSRGELIVDALPEYRGRFTRLMDRVRGLLNSNQAKGTNPAAMDVKC